MKLASLKHGRDGRLAVVSRDLTRYLAVTETARGGILLKGIGITRNDVSVVTNVTADHLGLQGIDTVDQLAEVKSVVPRITRRRGWAVLNGDDPRVYAMRNVIRASAWVFSRDPNSPVASYGIASRSDTHAAASLSRSSSRIASRDSK